MYKSPLMLWIVVVIAVVNLTGLSIVKSRGEFLEPIYTGPRVKGITWSSDSTTLSFQNQDQTSCLSAQHIGWNSYEISSGSLLESNTWQLQPLLSNSIHQELAIEGSTSQGTEFMFMSPNGAYIIGAKHISSDPRNNPVIIIKVEEGEIIETPLLALAIECGTERFNVHWSAYSSVAVLSSSALLAS
jgi:hypothetical protein